MRWQKHPAFGGFRWYEFTRFNLKINGAIFEVHRTLGEGFLEKVYENALLSNYGTWDSRSNPKFLYLFFTKV